jgi:hypothetical protein
MGQENIGKWNFLVYLVVVVVVVVVAETWHDL